MDYSNTPVTKTESPKQSGTKNLIIGLLVAAVAILAGFLIFNQSKNKETLQSQQAQLVKATEEKSDIQTSFDASLARLDSMTTANTQLQAQLTDKDGEIAKIKSEIRSILNKKNATAAELTKARNLINSLNGKISSLEEQIAALTNENDSLKVEGTALRAERETLIRNLDSTNVIKTNLEKTVDIGSTLNASNITITPIDVRNNGKEKVKTVAKRVDKLVVSFDVRNRIVQSGNTDIYVVVIGPDGKPITSTPSGTFITREEETIPFTAKLPVTLETAKTKNVQFAFAPGDHFKQGNYKIEIYQNGFLIGEGTRQLRKGGLFS